VYGFIDPITKKIRYIGRTNNFERRTKRHISNTLNKKTKKTYLNNWIIFRNRKGLYYMNLLIKNLVNSPLNMGKLSLFTGK
jgi:hypothetical protein